MCVPTAYFAAITSGEFGAAAELVCDDSIGFESGGNEGSWGDYREHHLAPGVELFEAFEPEIGEMSARPATMRHSWSSRPR